MRHPFDYLIVGAGFAGAVVAERLASDGGKRVLVIDRRNHIGGNAYDCLNDDGVLVHRYGPHIFHTNSDEVFAYLSQFTKWRPYEHRVRASVSGMLLPIPINLNTINSLYQLDLDSEQLERFFAARAERRVPCRTSEDVVVSRVGRELYELFFRGYTRKQWGLDPSDLDASVTARIPVRTNRDDRYFDDKHQAMPLDGYTRMFENMLDHPNVTVSVGVAFQDLIVERLARQVIFTGPIDEYFGYRYGKLPYRSLRFEHRTFEVGQLQAVAVVNYPNDQPYTRITEYKHLTGQKHAKTSVTYEYSQADGDPYYPIPRAENAAIYARYKNAADACPNVRFVGRLATYKYYNMDQVVAQSLATYAKIRGRRSWTEVA
ncbi:MAG: UDP-galactopyranose mutase [Candidatus Eremiobacteraeota bacterium]|nr:UDP-galactopyranose mutase [Candidatus Eremiobacteraeota bacterium]